MTKETGLYAAEPIDTLIAVVRGQKVILDGDLARVYGVSTKRLNEQVRRNLQRFPQDFAFRLSEEEATTLLRSRSQIATLKRGQNIKYLPFAFTEHGAIMAATVLNSPRAVQMSIFVVRAFVRMRQAFAGSQVLEKRLADIEKNLVLHDTALRDLYAKIRPLLLPPSVPSKTRIGFGIREKHAAYRVRLTRRRRTAG